MALVTELGVSARQAIRTLVIVAALIAAFVGSAAAHVAPVAHAGESTAPLKIVIIVGPTHGVTDGYLAKGEALAVLAESYGMDVRRVFHPNATWANVMANIQGANIVTYFGHGNGWPSPYAPFQEDTKNGFGLNEFAGGSQNSVKYYGANKIREKVVLAPNAIVFLNNLCYAEGNGEPGMGIPSYDVARQRVDNYAAGFLAPSVGARGVFAYGWQTVRDVLTLLMTTHQTMEGVFTTPGAKPEAYYGFVNWNAQKFDSVRTPGMTNYLDPDPADGFLRAFSGDLSMTTDEWMGGTVEDDGQLPVVSDLRAVASGNTIQASDEAPVVFTPNGDKLSETLTLAHDLSEGSYLDWTVRRDDGVVVRRFTTFADAGPGTSVWDGRRDTGRVVADGRYELTVVPKDRAGNVGEAATVRARVLTALKAPTALPNFFFARDADALAASTTLGATLTKEAVLTWTITDEAGTPVAVNADEVTTPAGTLSWVWDGTDTAGLPVPDGLYFSVLTATTADGTYSHRAQVRTGAFQVKGGGTGPVTVGQTVKYTILASEPLTGWPSVYVKQPGLAKYRVSTVKYSPTKFTATVTYRSGGTPGAVKISVTGTDTGGGTQATTRVVTLQ
jgi:flagellar hook assembly protein FlgD